MTELMEGIKRMGFDEEMAQNLYDIVEISSKAGREAAIEECAKVADLSAANAATWATQQMAVGIAACIRALVSSPPNPSEVAGK